MHRCGIDAGDLTVCDGRRLDVLWLRVRGWQIWRGEGHFIISCDVCRLPRRDLLKHDRIYQLHFVLRRLDYPRSWIDLLFPHEGLSSGHMEDYG